MTSNKVPIIKINSFSKSYVTYIETEVHYRWVLRRKIGDIGSVILRRDTVRRSITFNLYFTGCPEEVRFTIVLLKSESQSH